MCLAEQKGFGTLSDVHVDQESDHHVLRPEQILRLVLPTFWKAQVKGAKLNQDWGRPW